MTRTRSKARKPPEPVSFVIAGLVGGRPAIRVSVGVCQYDLLARHPVSTVAGPMPTQPIEAKATIDTARPITSVSEDILEALDLLPTNGRGGPRRVLMDRGYCVSLAIHSLTGERMVLKNIPCLSHRPSKEVGAVLLGWDVIGRRHWHFDGPQRTATIFC